MISCDPLLMQYGITQETTGAQWGQTFWGSQSRNCDSVQETVWKSLKCLRIHPFYFEEPDSVQETAWRSFPIFFHMCLLSIRNSVQCIEPIPLIFRHPNIQRPVLSWKGMGLISIYIYTPIILLIAIASHLNPNITCIYIHKYLLYVLHIIVYWKHIVYIYIYTYIIPNAYPNQRDGMNSISI